MVTAIHYNCTDFTLTPTSKPVTKFLNFFNSNKIDYHNSYGNRTDKRNDNRPVVVVRHCLP